MTSEQKLLLLIVQTWNIAARPEYRRFRCANCQKHLTGKVWHHFLITGGFLCPVHLCTACEKEFVNGNVVPQNPPAVIDRARFSPQYSDSSVDVFIRLAETWQDHPVAHVEKLLICDYCIQELESDEEGFQMGYHVWWKREDMTLIELHFDKKCAKKIGIEKIS